MKILIIQEKGRHLENENFREALSLQRGLKQISVESTVWGLNYENYTVNLNNLVNEHDVIFLLENHDHIGWLPDFSKFKNKIKIFWSIDSHVALKNHKNLFKNSKFDIHLNSSEQYIKHFKGTYNKSYWFPNAYDSTLILPKMSIKKKV